MSTSRLSGANCNLPHDRRIPLLSNIGLSERILRFESILDPRFRAWIVEKKKFCCDILISQFLARMTSSVIYCWSLGLWFLIRKTELKTVAKVRSNFFQVQNHVGSIICSDRLREISCAAKYRQNEVHREDWTSRLCSLLPLLCRFCRCRDVSQIFLVPQMHQ